MGFKIIGTGSALPENIITNDMLSRIMETSDEWISTRTGIRERRILSDGESLLGLGTAAARAALDNAGLSADKLDLLIVTTIGGDCKTPSLSCLIAGELGVNCITLDLNMACCGFIYGLSTADAYIKAGMAKNVLIVSAEALSRLVDWSERSSCILFGDGAGAAVLCPSESECVYDMQLTGGEGWKNLYAGRGTDNCPYNTYEDAGFLHMNGQEIYKFAVSSIVSRINGVLEKSALRAEDVSRILLHQANLRIIKSAVNRYGIGEEKFPHNIERCGNTSSASIPILLSECAPGLRRGDKIILCAFGAGLSSAACLLEW